MIRSILIPLCRVLVFISLSTNFVFFLSFNPTFTLPFSISSFQERLYTCYSWHVHYQTVSSYLCSCIFISISDSSSILLISIRYSSSKLPFVQASCKQIIWRSGLADTAYALGFQNKKNILI